MNQLPITYYYVLNSNILIMRISAEKGIIQAMAVLNMTRQGLLLTPILRSKFKFCCYYIDQNLLIWNSVEEIQFISLIKIYNMANESKFSSKIPISLCAGAVASFLTQPFQVIKTNMIASPSLIMRQLHQKIIAQGWSQYMRGGTLAMIRQAYGFTIYTSMISYLNKKLGTIEGFNKHYKYSIAALVGKMTALIFEAPLTLLKTRMELISSTSIQQQLSKIWKNPREQLCKGLNATILRESVFSLIHYNTYRFLKDDIFMAELGVNTIFLPAFFAGVMAITLSQPFQVIRNHISFQASAPILACARQIWAKQGWKGYFIGFVPRLIRKPINSGICWTILENLKPEQRNL